MKLSFIFFALIVASGVRAQELFIQTESASNMPVGRFGIRASYEAWQENGTISREGIEGMYGVTRYLMVHPQIYGSNQVNGFQLETFGGYAKYRLYIDDGFKYHFRVAAYAEALAGEQHSTYPSFSFKGSQPCVDGGIISTLLENRLALNFVAGASGALKDITLPNASYSNIKGVNASLSAGYLIYPPRYTSFSDPNVNIYAELLGYNVWYDQGNSGTVLSHHGDELLLSLGPQLILNSVARFDLSYVMLLQSSLPERRPNTFFARFEYNFYGS